VTSSQTHGEISEPSEWAIDHTESDQPRTLNFSGLPAEWFSDNHCGHLVTGGFHRV
jgi:hypothetical protein